jgi:dTDP-4-amino-4,6-dideoxygalactose transaminase
MKVPFLELKPGYDELRAEFDAAYHRVMDSGWYLLGKELEQFETEFAAYCEADYCVGLGNGLDALHLILRAYGIGAGDQVIVPSNTYIAAWLDLFALRHRHRDELQDSLAEAGIGTQIHYPIPSHLSGAYAQAGFPLAEETAQTELSLPLGPHLEPNSQETTIRVIHRFVNIGT